jgi:phosphoribosylamine--glycine ligase
MNVLIIGSGGREHAIAYKVKQSQLLEKLYCLPGNAGLSEISEPVKIKQNNFDDIIDFIKEKNIQFVIIGPEQPLADGMANILNKKNIPVFGPSKEAAKLESSKSFAKDFMQKYNIPTASYKVFTREQKANVFDFLENSKFPVVIKADGLAAGKGVVITTCFDDAKQTIIEFFDNNIFGNSADKIVIEEFLTGEEASVFAVSDGNDFVILSSAQDHKRVFDNDEGKNTGGMGAYSPAPVVNDKILNEIKENIIISTIQGMKKEGTPFVGCLYCGIIITNEGTKVIEFNCRFGDPETQIVLPLVESDFLELLYLSATSKLKNYQLSLSNKTAVCVVLASQGYPDKYETDKIISGLKDVDNETLVFHAGTKIKDGLVVTSGGRVLGITVLSNSLQEAINKVYSEVEKISFDGLYYRKDIGKKGLKYYRG